MRRRTIALCVIVSILVLCAFGRMLCREGQKKAMEEEMEKHLVQGGVYVPTPKEVWENPYIYRYNHKLCREKGLIEGDSLDNFYLCMQAIYRANLDALLLKKLDIRKLDDELEKSKLGFVSRRQEDKELYELYRKVSYPDICKTPSKYKPIEDTIRDKILPTRWMKYIKNSG